MSILCPDVCVCHSIIITGARGNYSLFISPTSDTEVPLSRRSSWEAEGMISREAPLYPVFRSPQRDSALVLCGWSFTTPGHSLDDFVKRHAPADPPTLTHCQVLSVCTSGRSWGRGMNVLRPCLCSVGMCDVESGRSQTEPCWLDSRETRREVEADAWRCVCVYRLYSPLPLPCLTASQLQLIALALSGFSPVEIRLWHQTCLQLRSHVSSPYLRAVFNFLSSSGRDEFRDVTVRLSLRVHTSLICTSLASHMLPPPLTC